jgi:hypothetical protein
MTKLEMIYEMHPCAFFKFRGLWVRRIETFRPTSGTGRQPRAAESPVGSFLRQPHPGVRAPLQGSLSLSSHASKLIQKLQRKSEKN